MKDKGKRAFSFRLINFGRSYQIRDGVSESEWNAGRAHEEVLTQKLFEPGWWLKKA